MPQPQTEPLADETIRSLARTADWIALGLGLAFGGVMTTLGVWGCVYWARNLFASDPLGMGHGLASSMATGRALGSVVGLSIFALSAGLLVLWSLYRQARQDKRWMLPIRLFMLAVEAQAVHQPKIAGSQLTSKLAR